MGVITRGALTTESELDVLWSELTSTATGDSPILSYYLQWDNGTSSTWSELKGSSTPDLALTFIAQISSG
jgi:hypothetical protein